MAMKTIHSWRAKRAGGRITIYGKDQAGADVRVPNVDVIECGDLTPIATDKNGDKYSLLPPNALGDGQR